MLITPAALDRDLARGLNLARAAEIVPCVCSEPDRVTWTTARPTAPPGTVSLSTVQLAPIHGDTHLHTGLRTATGRGVSDSARLKGKGRHTCHEHAIPGTWGTLSNELPTSLSVGTRIPVRLRVCNDCQCSHPVRRGSSHRQRQIPSAQQGRTCCSPPGTARRGRRGRGARRPGAAAASAAAAARARPPRPRCCPRCSWRPPRGRRSCRREQIAGSCLSNIGQRHTVCSLLDEGRTHGTLFSRKGRRPEVHRR